MPFKKGKEKTGGRKTGTPNKETKVIRDWISAFLEKQTETLEADINSLPPKEKMSTIIALMEYSVPKLNRTELVSEGDNAFTLNVVTHSHKKNGGGEPSND